MKGEVEKRWRPVVGDKVVWTVSTLGWSVNDRRVFKDSISGIAH